jgi:hypothetical protein
MTKNITAYNIPGSITALLTVSEHEWQHHSMTASTHHDWQNR